MVKRTYLSQLKLMRVITLNANGIRAARRKGLAAYLVERQPEVLCLQECRIDAAAQAKLPELLPGYYLRYRHAERPGYSGVALYTRYPPDTWIDTCGYTLIDSEARYLEARFGGLSIVSLYLPSGSASAVRQDLKMALLDWFGDWLQQRANDGRHWLLCGDWNIAHREIDLKNWRNNRKNSGFLPEERAWLDQVFDSWGWVDVFRALHPEREQYTWWSQRGRARTNNVGWRIDYQIATPALAATAQYSDILREPVLSDHAPLQIDYDYSLEPHA